MGCTQLHIAQPVLEPLGADVQSFGQIQNFTRVTPRATLVIGDGALAKVAQASQFGLRKAALQAGVQADGEFLRAASASLLRQGGKHAWLEIMLDEGRNRQIRRLLEAFDVRVLRLVRVAIGPIELGTLAKGAWRLLDAHERDELAPTGGR